VRDWKFEWVGNEVMCHCCGGSGMTIFGYITLSDFAILY
jgi:hypothetical protein